MNDLFSQALDLMVAGMGFVFVFLTVLVGVTTVMSKIAIRLQPDEPETPARAPAVAPAATNDPQLIAVITAAVAQYRSRHKK